MLFKSRTITISPALGLAQNVMSKAFLCQNVQPREEDSCQPANYGVHALSLSICPHLHMHVGFHVDVNRTGPYPQYSLTAAVTVTPRQPLRPVRSAVRSACWYLGMQKDDCRWRSSFALVAEQGLDIIMYLLAIGACNVGKHWALRGCDCLMINSKQAGCDNAD